MPRRLVQTVRDPNRRRLRLPRRTLGRGELAIETHDPVS